MRLNAGYGTRIKLNPGHEYQHPYKSDDSDRLETLQNSHENTRSAYDNIVYQPCLQTVRHARLCFHLDSTFHYNRKSINLIRIANTRIDFQAGNM